MNTSPVLSGDLEFLPLAELLQILGGSNFTGVLLITGEFSPYRGEIHFAAGEPVDAEWGTHQGTQAVYALFGWRQGRFEFRQQGFSRNRTINKSRMEIVLDAMRMLDDGLISEVGAPQKIPGPPRPCNGLEKDLPTITGSMIDYDYILSEETFQAGRKIVSQGSYGNWIWVILEGKALVSRETAGVNTSICYFGEGAFIGSFETLLFGDHLRTTTVTATGDVHMAVLNTHRLSSEFRAISPEFRDYLLRLSARVTEATDDLISLDGVRGESRTKGSAGEDRGKTEYGRETLGLEKFHDEYVLLSRTFKSSFNSL